MRWTAYIAIMLFLFAVGGCTDNPVVERDLGIESAPMNQSTEQVEELAIYRYLLSDVVEANSLAVVESTSTLGKASTAELSSQFDRNLVNEFITLNKDPKPITRKLKSKNVIFLSHEHIQSIFEDRGWTNFYESYPKGVLVEFSRPAFNNARTQALVYRGITFDHGKGGIGRFYLLRKVEGKWQIYDQRVSWIV